ncbi:MAG: indole-3-glycerol phosphate synthase TrpC [Eubacteriales bacterium]|nr:indole-3-glycerol phosphate synthase TrpC [Eubacteriales bacterium]
MTILDELAGHARERVEADKRTLSLKDIRRAAGECPAGGGDAFRGALSSEGLSVICEIKKASPSKGVIDPVFDYMSVASSYEAAGADALSCLTEPKWFMGSDEIFKSVRSMVSVPMLRKDFTVDEYQLYQARLLGADCVLLICSILDEGRLGEYLGICRSLGLAALTETHSREEIDMALRCGADIIGINNRDLKDFSVDLSTSEDLRGYVPKEVLCVAESGVTTPEDASRLRRAGADAVLVGEAMMRSSDRAGLIKSMKEASA